MTRQILVTVLGAVAITACSETSESAELPERSAEPTRCGTITTEDDGVTYTQPVFYVFDAINEQLDRNEDLREFSGIDHVDSCEAAKAFVDAKNEFGADEPTEDEADQAIYPTEDVHRIGNGQWSEFQPSVDLIIRQGPGYSEQYRCTGSIIGRREIVTAAHCIYQDGWRPFRVSVRSGGTTQCIANCSNSTSSNAYGYRHPNYSGVGDAGDDVGVIVFPSDLPAPANSSSDRLRMMISKTWKNAPIKVYGWGADKHSGSGGGVSREGSMTVSWSGSKHFTANATTTRACKGDSGGAATRSASGDFPLMVGVESEMHDFTGSCPNGSGFNRWAHIGQKVPWIESKIGRTCNRYTSSTNSSISYARCW